MSVASKTLSVLSLHSKRNLKNPISSEIALSQSPQKPYQF